MQIYIALRHVTPDHKIGQSEYYAGIKRNPLIRAQQRWNRSLLCKPHRKAVYGKKPKASLLVPPKQTSPIFVDASSWPQHAGKPSITMLSTSTDRYHTTPPSYHRHASKHTASSADIKRYLLFGSAWSIVLCLGIVPLSCKGGGKLRFSFKRHAWPAVDITS